MSSTNSDAGPIRWHSRFGTASSGASGSGTSLGKLAMVSLIALPTLALGVPGYRVWQMSQRRALTSTSSTAVSGSRPAAPPRRLRSARLSAAQSQISQPTASSSSSLSSAPPPRKSPTKSLSHPPSPRLPNTGVPPPRIRSTTPASSFPPSTHPKTNARAKAAPSAASAEAGAAALEAAKDPLYAAGAFTLATALVGVGLLLGVWGTQKALGVETVDEFAARMRDIIRRYIPQLSEGLYMQALPDVQGSMSADPRSHSDRYRPLLDAHGSWDPKASEDRLSAAFEKGGFEAWSECALVEMELERRVTAEATAARTQNKPSSQQ